MADLHTALKDMISGPLTDYGIYLILGFVIILKLASIKKERNIPQFENGQLTIIDSNKASFWYSTLFALLFLTIMIRWNIHAYQNGNSSDFMIYHVISGIIFLFAISGIFRHFRRISKITCRIDRNSRTISLRELGPVIARDHSYSFDEIDSFDCETKVVRSSSGSSSSSKTLYRLNLILKNGETIHLREKFGNSNWKRWYKAVRDFDGDGRIDHKDISYTDSVHENITSETITYSDRASKMAKVPEMGSSHAHWLTKQKRSDGPFVLLIFQPQHQSNTPKKRSSGFKLLLSRLFYATVGRVFLKFYLMSNSIQLSDVNNLKGIVFDTEIRDILHPYFAVLTDNSSTTLQFLNDQAQQELIQLAKFAKSKEIFTLLVLFNKDGLRLAYSKADEGDVQGEMGMAGVRIAKSVR